MSKPHECAMINTYEKGVTVLVTPLGFIIQLESCKLFQGSHES